VPHFTTVQKAAQRLLRAAPVAELLAETVGQIMGRKRRVPLAAIDPVRFGGVSAARC